MRHDMRELQMTAEESTRPSKTFRILARAAFNDMSQERGSWL